MVPHDEWSPHDPTWALRREAGEARRLSRALLADLARIEADIAGTLDLLAARAAAEERGPQAAALRRSAEHARANSERIGAYLSVPGPGPRRRPRPLSSRADRLR